MRELVIIGAGPAGLTAAIYARRAGIDVLVCEGGMYGGQLVNTEIIKNYPSYKSVEGWELARNMYLQAEECGAEFLYEGVLDVYEKDGIFTVKTDGGETECLAVIIANGSKRLKIGCKGSDRYEGLGVSYCATCDGQLYKGQPVAVVGGGENAFEDALYLSALCTKVHLCAKKITASEETVNNAKEKDNIIIYEGYYPTEIYGETRVTGLKISDKEQTIDLSAAAVFTA
ncbi:MAG: FAD-dependent oxidoreductase, partial [Clostridia bacterium]|nr:FAD-dependent oxidoreductase [Clostridia bacterium]